MTDPDLLAHRADAAKRDPLFTIGIWATVAWFGFGAVLMIVFAKGWGDLKPADVANIFAGAFGPIVLLWLILGFKQQGKELQLNTEALRLQVEELKNTVKHQGQLVQVSREQLEEERAARRRAASPSFVLAPGPTGSGPQGVTYEVHFSNTGAIATDVHLVTESATVAPLISQDFFPTVGSNPQAFTLRYQSVPTEVIRINIRYMDRDGLPGHVAFLGRPDGVSRMRFQLELTTPNSA